MRSATVHLRAFAVCVAMMVNLGLAHAQYPAGQEGDPGNAVATAPGGPGPGCPCQFGCPNPDDPNCVHGGYVPFGMGCPPGYPGLPPAYTAERVGPVVPCWCIKADAMFLHRSPQSAHTLVQDFLTKAPLMDAQDVREDWGYGPRIEGAWNFAGDWEVDIVYFGIDDWHGTQTYTSFGNLEVPALNAGAIYDTVTADFRAHLYNGEINLARRLSGNVTLLSGFRYLELRETASLDGDGGRGPAGVHVEAENRLYGGQIGANVTIGQLMSRLYLDGFIKAGVYGCDTVRNYTWSGFVAQAPYEDHLGHVAFVGEVSLKPTFQVTDWLSLYGAYEFLCIQGVAMAPDQLNALGAIEPLHAGRTVYYHGARAGLELKW